VLLGDTLDPVLLAKYATYSPTYRQFLALVRGGGSNASR
jgi:hypothetical protein